MKLTTTCFGWGDQTFNEMFDAAYRDTYPDAKVPGVRQASTTPVP